MTRSAALLAAVLVLVLTACTGGGEPAAPPPAPAPAAGAAAEPGAVGAAVRKLADAGSARLTVDLVGPTGPIRATGPARFDPFATELSVTLGSREARVRAVGPDAWVRFGDATDWQPLAPGLLPVGAVSGALQAASGLRDVTEQPGAADVDGVPAVRHTGTVDLTAARAAVDPAAATRLDELAGLVSPTPRFTAWLGARTAEPADRDRLLRLILEPVAPAEDTRDADAAGVGALTVTFAEPGVEVRVAAP
ncbi:hypothetical protein [Pseudonocardia sp. HH130630-07]|uniref:hypothetical protein n=1 Tax=Pseudonocardia sp. HH130630-07 TaxID=1690815 RepID=UPI000814FF4A|nr:hypothetical protein [Pseudonocardia sp. HH130630-07]ANY05874.1 hypothetical protein AFB00_05670 [Pseudonocardia sp. HH130630-07]